MKRYKMLHIHAPIWEHSESYIVGNRLALEELKRAIDKALEGGPTGFEVFAGDGEGYGVYVALREGDFKEWCDLRLPYSDEGAQDSRQGIIAPHELVGLDLIQAVLPPPWVEDDEKAEAKEELT